MPTASTVVTGSNRRTEDALDALRRLGTVDESSIHIEELSEVEIYGEVYEIPATKVTAEVTPHLNPTKTER